MSILASYFRIDGLSLFIGASIIFFFVLTVIYSFPNRKDLRGSASYYASILLTLLCSLGAAIANQWLLFLLFWGALGLFLYLLINQGNRERTPATAAKTLIIVGGSDAFMILGVGLLHNITGSFGMANAPISIHSPAAMLAYLCLAVGALAKAGAMPFHSWVPDMAEDAPVAVTAFLLASLDKLLGIYLLFRLSTEMFELTPALQTLLMAIGSVTIVAAAMMALVQGDLKRLLGYSAVSQVGYMVLGIGTGNPVGIAGGIFHMLNHSIYESSLFMGGGAVEKSAGTTELDKLGGLAKTMPAAFGTFLVASLAISGVPPLNGFASKWMIYQGIIESIRTGHPLSIVWLAAAMFGSALTLAYFMKVVHAVFMGQPSVHMQRRKNQPLDAGFLMTAPAVALAFLCILFGIFAASIPLKMLIFPCLGFSVPFQGIWNSGLATALLVVAMAAGAILYWLGSISRTRQTAIFIGGETVEENPEMRVSGGEFYNTIEDLGGLKKAYKLAEERRLDPYDAGTAAAMSFTRVLQRLHHGVLPSYLAWCLLGATILLFLMR